MALLVGAFVRTSVNNNEKMVDILVANQNLPKGTEVAESDFRWQQWPKSALPLGHIPKTENWAEMYIGNKVRRGIAAGEPVIANSLLVQEGSSFLAASLSEGMRAVSIPVKGHTAVAGFVRPGDWVDVLLTYEVRLQTRDNREKVAEIVSKYASETVLGGVKVLAVDQEVQDMGRDAKPARTITLEVEPEHAQVLTLADRMGDLSLSLRSIGEDGELQKNTEQAAAFTTDLAVGRALREANLASLGDPELAEESETEIEPEVPPRTIRVYHGGSVGNITVQGGR
ncbi:MAG: hypothetical protein Alpg2KO_26750 [Alphaproteobacteria bacterium]